jgi:hypothetical protein
MVGYIRALQKYSPNKKCETDAIVRPSTIKKFFIQEERAFFVFISPEFLWAVQSIVLRAIINIWNRQYLIMLLEDKI